MIGRNVTVTLTVVAAIGETPSGGSSPTVISTVDDAPETETGECRSTGARRRSASPYVTVSGSTVTVATSKPAAGVARHDRVDHTVFELRSGRPGS